MKILRRGSTGPQVELLQAALNKAGFNVGTPDGIFGGITQQALISFQQQYGLIADGILGPLTFNFLHRYLTGYVEHVIVPGNTIFNLATTYNTTIEAITIANPSINPYQLVIGQIIVIPLNFPVMFTDISFSSMALGFVIDGLIKRYPFIKQDMIGTSTLGQKIYVLRIGTGDNEVSYNGSHHANEWITTPILMKFLEDYAFSYAHNLTFGNQLASDIYMRTSIYIVPMVNPDGVDLVTGEFDQDSKGYQLAYQYSNPQIPFPSGWKANIRGVDLNLNYPARWNVARDIKYAMGYNKPGPRDFVGERPLSEIESRNMAIFTMLHNFRLTLSYHTQGEVIFWQFFDYYPPQQKEIGELLAKVSGYVLAETPEYASNAGYKDWFVQTFYMPGYTIEAGLGVNPLPISDFEKIYNDNLPMLIVSALV